jgi:hypothetical protein
VWKQLSMFITSFLSQAHSAIYNYFTNYTYFTTVSHMLCSLSSLYPANYTCFTTVYMLHVVLALGTHSQESKYTSIDFPQ